MSNPFSEHVTWVVLVIYFTRLYNKQKLFALRKHQKLLWSLGRRVMCCSPVLFKQAFRCVHLSWTAPEMQRQCSGEERAHTSRLGGRWNGNIQIVSDYWTSAWQFVLSIWVWYESCVYHTLNILCSSDQQEVNNNLAYDSSFYCYHIHTTPFPKRESHLILWWGYGSGLQVQLLVACCCRTCRRFGIISLK